MFKYLLKINGFLWVCRHAFQSSQCVNFKFNVSFFFSFFSLAKIMQHKVGKAWFKDSSKMLHSSLVCFITTAAIQFVHTRQCRRVRYDFIKTKQKIIPGTSIGIFRGCSCQIDLGTIPILRQHILDFSYVSINMQ